VIRVPHLPNARELLGDDRSESLLFSERLFFEVIDKRVGLTLRRRFGHSAVELRE